jgi:hypothetical protein
MFRRKKKSATGSTTTEPKPKTQVDEKNVRVGTIAGNDEAESSMTAAPSLPSSLEVGETADDTIFFDRRAVKAASKRSNTTAMESKSVLPLQLLPIPPKLELRTSPRVYGNACENTQGFYSSRVTVKDWQFETHARKITVPVGCMVIFSVDKSERSMVEINVQVHDGAGCLLGTSPCLTAGQSWEFFCLKTDVVEFQDINDEELSGTISIVEGDKGTQFASHAARKYQADKKAKADQKRKYKEKMEEDIFQKELIKKMEESKIVDEQVHETLTRARSPSPTFQENSDDGISSELDEARRKAVVDSLAMYQSMKR